MPVLPILKEPHILLRQPSRKLKLPELPGLKKLAKDMLETMRATSGIGLAAPQIGQSIRLAVIGAEAARLSNLKRGGDLVLINPVITRKSWRRVRMIEGCLSVPGKHGEIERHQKIYVKALDLEGKPLIFEARDYLAQVIQHEVDHLNGKLYIDRAKNVQEIKKE